MEKPQGRNSSTLSFSKTQNKLYLLGGADECEQLADLYEYDFGKFGFDYDAPSAVCCSFLELSFGCETAQGAKIIASPWSYSCVDLIRTRSWLPLSAYFVMLIG